MIKLSQFAKEEIIKNVIDKLVFGLLASLILFGMQKCAEDHSREQIKKLAILQMESQFIIEGASQIKNEFSLYLIEASRFINDEVPLDNNQRVKLYNQIIKLKSEIEVISAHHLAVNNEGKSFIKAMEDLNMKLISYSDGDIEPYRSDLTELKKKYQIFLTTLKKAAIMALSTE
ncbi:MAG: hypothetical protein JEZ11_01425 [Desulfobacterales bacterium]|nr:hypothetical protein [Desulfobacterales bacterium]